MTRHSRLDLAVRSNDTQLLAGASLSILLVMLLSILGCGGLESRTRAVSEGGFYVKLATDQVSLGMRVKEALARYDIVSVELSADPLGFPVVMYGSAVPEQVAQDMARTAGQFASISPQQIRIEPLSIDMPDRYIFIDLPSSRRQQEYAAMQEEEKRKRTAATRSQRTKPDTRTARTQGRRSPKSATSPKDTVRQDRSPRGNSPPPNDQENVQSTPPGVVY